MNNKRKILSKLAYFRRIILQLKKRSNWKGALLPIYGFTPDKMELYKDIKNKKYLYVNDYFRYNKFWQITDNYRVLFNDKLVNYYFLKNFTSKLCPIYGYFDQNNVFNIIDDNAKRTGPFFIKPRNGFAGRGVILTDDYKSIEPPKNSIVCPQINNNNYASKIYPDSLNTIRILTCVVDNKVELITAVHRFGSTISKQKNVDSFSQGGISALIDMNTGTIIKSCRKSKSGFREDFTLHPDTKEQIVGVKINNWKEMISELKKIHENVKFVKSIGWDIAMIENDFLIIEANHLSDVDLIQCHGPLLANFKAKEFFNHYINKI